MMGTREKSGTSNSEKRGDQLIQSVHFIKGFERKEILRKVQYLICAEENYFLIYRK